MSERAVSIEPEPAPAVERPWIAHYEPGVPAEVEIPDVTYDGLLRRAAQEFPDRVALSFFGATQTFRQLDDAVDRFACHVDTLGLRPGDRISLHLPTSPAFVIAFLGALRAGCIAVPISPLLVERELVVLLRETTPALSVTLDLLVPRVRDARAEVGDLPRPAGGAELLVTGIVDSLKAPLKWLYPLKARREGRWKPVAESDQTPNLFRCLTKAPGWRFESAGAASQVAALLPTGGTTGIPKAAALTHRNLVANAVQVASWFPDRDAPDVSVLCALPYFHSYGLTVDLGYALLTGATQILLPRFETDQVLKAIAKHRPRLFPGAPIFYRALLDDPRLSKHDLSSIEACISGAAPLPPDVQERFEAVTGGRVSEGYGLTEASPVTHCNPIHGDRRTGTIGLPFPSTEARIVDLDTGRRVLGPGEVGELCIRGPQVFAGYWSRPDETDRMLRDGWLHTGDVATMDADGYFTIVDRVKDMLIVSGVNVYPSEIEEVLTTHPAVAEAAVVGQPDARRGEVPRAFVVPFAGATVTGEELLAWCRDRLNAVKRPVEIEIRDELPKTMIGKVLRRALHQPEAEPAPAEPAAETDEAAS